VPRSHNSARRTRPTPDPDAREEPMEQQRSAGPSHVFREVVARARIRHPRRRRRIAFGEDRSRRSGSVRLAWNVSVMVMGQAARPPGAAAPRRGRRWPSRAKERAFHPNLSLCRTLTRPPMIGRSVDHDPTRHAGVSGAPRASSICDRGDRIQRGRAGDRQTGRGAPYQADSGRARRLPR
jgi:hypothetical protein